MVRDAQQACQRYAPFGDSGGQQQPDPKIREMVLKFAQCMRDNGVPNFPDPQVGMMQLEDSVTSDPDFPRPNATASRSTCPTFRAPGNHDAGQRTWGPGAERGRRRAGAGAASSRRPAWIGLVVVAAGAVTLWAAAFAPARPPTPTRGRRRSPRSPDRRLRTPAVSTANWATVRPRPVVNRLPGTITGVPASGTTVTRGQPLYQVDNGPIMLMVVQGARLPGHRPG